MEVTFHLQTKSEKKKKEEYGLSTVMLGHQTGPNNFALAKTTTTIKQTKITTQHHHQQQQQNNLL